MRNERGSTLILVLLISTVFLVLGLAIFSAVIGGTKRTESRRTEAAAAQSSVEDMNAVTADFQAGIDSIAKSGSLQDMLKTSSYEGKLQALLQDLQSRYTSSGQTTGKTLQIHDKTGTLLEDDSDYKSRYFTRYYEFVLVYVSNPDAAHPTITKTVRRNMYISPTPSFLQYTVGSEHTLQLNGASSITGNVYGDDISVANAARYVDTAALNGADSAPYKTVNTLYPQVRGDIIVNSQLSVYKDSISKQGIAVNTFTKHQLAFQSPSAFLASFYTPDKQEEELPNIYKAYNRFVPVELAATFADKLNELELDGRHLQLTKADISSRSTVVNSMFSLLGGPVTEAGVAGFNAAGHSLYLIEKDQNPADVQLDFSAPQYAGKNVVLLTDVAGNATARPTFILNRDLKLASHQWLVVDGNLEIYNDHLPLAVSGNILVMGDILIHGDAFDFGHEQDKMQFDSTIYTTGKASIFSTDITGLDGKQLVLLSQGDLLLTRINEFDAADNSITPMDAYLYTDGRAELYGVASLLSIHGGLFAKQELVMNAIRQNAVQKPAASFSANTPYVPLTLASREVQQTQSSRLQVTYDRSVVLDQLDALPRVNTLQVIIDDSVVENGDTTKKDDAP
ncbi:type IV pilus modification PilV family protein [Ectobacillus ponti]|uniref:Uncharacterized protein n=1 Tax=Ectobacillus ponti TaxID=2961894 RepID=A0AA41X4C6_9BACI|nr:hypothetical protein [Ectobacillus ponti]MCP8968492.1 hypothetical protein [Ectobacillus ponti]